MIIKENCSLAPNKYKHMHGLATNIILVLLNYSYSRIGLKSFLNESQFRSQLTKVVVC